MNYEKELLRIGKSFKEVRKSKKITQDEFGKLIGIKKSQVSKIETNPQDMKFSTIMRMVEFLDMEIVISKGNIIIKNIL
ncbi:MAG: helix-turn-helix transcriptional regulator [Lutibacter sp.]|jgi:transcriptional regulator with XRE-family HTH domain